jgi:hypothetical protein
VAAKPKKKRIVRPKRKPRAKPTVGTTVEPLPQVPARDARGGVLAATHTAPDSETGVSLLVLATLGLAIACFGVAALPAASARPGALSYFVATRHVHLAALGLAFLAAAGFALLLARGP